MIEVDDRVGVKPAGAPTPLVPSPLLLALAVAVRAGSPGPVLFRQVRVGEDGRPFVMFTFRTMFEHASASAAD